MFHKSLRALTMTRALALCPLLAFTALSTVSSHALAAAEVDTKDILSLSLAELTNLEVTSVSKKAEKEIEAAAAIYVITQEDIKRSGATAIPELLRMVPGITVTRSGSHDWTVTSRGFNDQFSNKLLVLMDGRTIYSHLFSGVIWDVQDTMLEDIDRIEVIRGPGATLWGANAVNGVINIITKNAKDTQGGLAVASAGNQVKGIGSVRYGGKLSENSHVRAYAKQTAYNSEFSPTGGSANDNWHKSQAGFKGESKLSESDNINIQGDIYSIDEDVNYTIPDLTSGTFTSTAEGAKASGGNLMARWEKKNSKDSQLSLQAYFDNTYYKTSFFNDETNTIDLDFQQVWTGWSGQEIVWGAGYRFINSKNDPSSAQYTLLPQNQNDNLFNAFVQDKIALIPEELFLTLGSKFEHNDYTGVEVQPSVRLSWLPADNQTVWASISRAVHTPSPGTDAVQQSLVIIPPSIAVPIPTLLALVGNRSLESEELIAYELGYRIQPTKTLSFDVAGFYNDYDKLFNGNLGDFTIVGPYVFQPVLAQNTNSAHSVGAELSAKWNVSNQWQMAGSYSYISLAFDSKSSIGYSFVGKHPKHQFNVRSTYLFPQGVEMTNALYFVDDLNGVAIPSYYRFDTRLSYEIMEGMEVSLVGQNLLDNRHQEFSPFFYKSAAEIGRSVYGSVAFKF
jgi:iron complex outermembrane recepter protein